MKRRHTLSRVFKRQSLSEELPCLSKALQGPDHEAAFKVEQHLLRMAGMVVQPTPSCSPGHSENSILASESDNLGIEMSAPMLANCENVSKLFSFSGPQFHHLLNDLHNNSLIDCWENLTQSRHVLLLRLCTTQIPGATIEISYKVSDSPWIVQGTNLVTQA